MEKTEFDCQRCYCIFMLCWVICLGAHNLVFKMGLKIHIPKMFFFAFHGCFDDDLFTNQLKIL